LSSDARDRNYRGNDTVTVVFLASNARPQSLTAQRSKLSARRAAITKRRTAKNVDKRPSSGQFDAIVSSHVIEHVHDPRSFVARAGHLLARDGTMTVLTPNFGSVGQLVLPRSSEIHVSVCRRVTQERIHIFRLTPGRAFENDHALSENAIQRRRAVRATGNFLGDAGNGARVSDVLFRGLEAAGNQLFDWGEEIQCAAVKS